ncbi:hypothetical protein AI29_14305 [bacteria symbiont BFo2 of Frankliniella occidentalis]|nr:hypothetical protein AI29_14305 [bacteria symbiont BFo2 of Frankliniella occidentalis]KYP93077.1 hypothetical protein WB60_03795 [bacteria symbiont BFo2 of Frankliniella occidentalis]KYP93351.1 hypothetical protein WB67_13825 [bacteria symbiont BFo2 of Frankliniella occidentalis]
MLMTITMMTGTAMVIQVLGGMTAVTGMTTTAIMTGTLTIDRIMTEEIFSMAVIILDQVEDTLINIIKIDIGLTTGTGTD